MGLNKDGKVESLGMPIQQTAYILSVAGDSCLSQPQKNHLNNIMEEGKLKASYRPLIVDNIKWSRDFHKKYFNRHYGKFLLIYGKLVFHHPIPAIKGFLLANEGFWDPFKQMNVAYVSDVMWPGSRVKQRNYLSEKFHVSVKPHLRGKLFISSAVYIWIFLTEFVLSVYRNGFWTYRNLGFFMGIALALTLWIATPIAYSLRYAFAFPFLIMLGFVSLLLKPQKTLS